jgi:dihydroorotate dehydrogenase
MPDWTYHPFFKPILFRLRAETGRRVTLRLLAIQARSVLGRRIFRLFGHGPPPPELAVTVFGLRFPAPVGLGAGIDTHAVSVSVMQHLGFGFMIVGPVGAEAVARAFDADPLRIAEGHALVSSMCAWAPSAREIAARLGAAPELGVPVGVALRGDRLEEAILALDGPAAFYVVRANDIDQLETARAATRKPILVQLSADGSHELPLASLERARDLGADGCVILGGISTGLLPDGEITGPFLLERTKETIARVLRRFEGKLPIVAAGGILTPQDALACLDAGASLVSLFEGLVYAGPGLPGRIVHALEARVRGAPCEAAPAADSADNPGPSGPRAMSWQRRDGTRLLALTGCALIASGLGAILLASTVALLPYDFQYLGLSASDLCGRNACRIVHFMQHDRVSFGGSILAIGILYLELAKDVQKGRAWAWWTLLLTGAVGFASFLAYLGYGYLDVWHGRATLALLPCFVGGLVLTYPELERPRGPGSLVRSTVPAWTWSPAGRGRLCLTFSAFGMILGGVLILWVGMTTVFVPQDLAFMGVTVRDLQAVSPRLVPLIAHDRAGFGGGLFSGGLTVLFSVWCGTRPGARGQWWALLLAGLVGFGCAIGVHPIVGYTSFVHLAPAYAGTIAFLVGIALLHGPMCRADGQASRFPDV